MFNAQKANKGIHVSVSKKRKEKGKDIPLAVHQKQLLVIQNISVNFLRSIYVSSIIMLFMTDVMLVLLLFLDQKTIANSS